MRTQALDIGHMDKLTALIDFYDLEAHIPCSFYCSNLSEGLTAFANIYVMNDLGICRLIYVVRFKICHMRKA